MDIFDTNSLRTCRVNSASGQIEISRGIFVGRDHDPADPVPVYERYNEWNDV